MYNRDATEDIPIPNPIKDFLERKIHEPLVVDATWVHKIEYSRRYDGYFTAQIVCYKGSKMHPE